MKSFLTGITFMTMISSVASATGNQQDIYPDVESFKKSILVGIVELKEIDINNDGTKDVVVFSSGGEENFLDVLLNDGDHFVHLRVPVGESYEVVGTPKRYEIKIGFGTFPKYGDIHGSDKLYWYDFYEIVGTALSNTNSRHQELFQEMKKRYETRIVELEKEIETLNMKKSEKDLDVAALELSTRLRQDHIQRYRDFIGRALKIIQGKNGT